MGCIQIYTGEGKGKTTAALGLALRAIGRGFRVDMIQFLKRGGCGEHVSCEKLGINVHPGCEVSAPPWVGAAREEWARHTQCQLAKAKEILTEDKADVVILDELLGAVKGGYLTEADALELMNMKGEHAELIITGRGASDALIARADLVTQMTKIKHYLDKGVPAREGIEF